MPPLTLRQLNRATLQRQLLLERADLSVPAAIEQVAGLQAQVQNPPYIGLWSRLRDFRHTDLTAAMEAREVVRAAAMRSTLHLLTARDYLRFFRAFQPALVRGMNSFHGRNLKGISIPPLVAAAERAIGDSPRAMGEIEKLLTDIEPNCVPAALGYAVRSHLPLVQVPPAGTWRKGGRIAYALPHLHIGAAVADEADLAGLLRRYLAAFGPSSPMDAQTWLGITKLKEAFDLLKSELVTYHDEAGVELFDLPDMPPPADDTPAPVRFVPEYDNLLIGHADRRRIIADDYRKRVFLSAGRVRSTILLDGFVEGAWRIERVKRTATLVIEPFRALTAAEQAALSDEGTHLARFCEDDADTWDVRFEESS
jgi:hypothetical protein